MTLKVLLDDRIQAANIFSTSPLIASNNLVAIEDPKNSRPAGLALNPQRQSEEPDQGHPE